MDSYFKGGLLTSFELRFKLDVDSSLLAEIDGFRNDSIDVMFINSFVNYLILIDKQVIEFLVGVNQHYKLDNHNHS